MKKLFIIMAMALMVSVQAFAKPYNVPRFDKIVASGIYQITLVKSNECKVDVTSSTDLADKIKVEVRGGTLYLSLTKVNKTSGNSWIKATVSMPSVSAIDLSGVSTLSSNDKFISNGKFDLDMSGSAKLNGLTIDAPGAGMEISGASNVTLAGKIAKCIVEIAGASKASFAIEASSFEIESSGSSQVSLGANMGDLNANGSGASSTVVKNSHINNLELELSGASVFKGENYTVANAVLEIGGASKVDINVTERMTAQLSGASKLSYSAPSSARISTEVSGASKVSKR